MYSRELEGKTYTFGVSGKLWRDALLMYDHQTRSLWSHITGEAIQGKLKGKKLTPLVSMPQIAWKAWKENYPDTKVLSVNFRGRMVESLSHDSYQRYHKSQDTGVSGTEYTDKRLPNKQLVIGVQVQRKYGDDGLAGHAGADGQPGAENLVLLDKTVLMENLVIPVQLTNIAHSTAPIRLHNLLNPL